jgi:hypothetical protein
MAENVNREEVASSGSYDIALICLYGHVVNDSKNGRPIRNTSFSERCGQKTVSECSTCGAVLRGCYHDQNFGYMPVNQAPAFCYNCGSMFPWTQARLDAAGELADLLNTLTDDEKESLKQSVDTIVRNTPAAPVAEHKYKLPSKKAGKEAAEGMRAILTDIASETLKKAMFG